MYKNFLKPLLDVVLSAIALVILVVPMLIIAIIVKLDSPGPVLFWQKRVGIHKKTFMMPKFRSMYIDAPSNAPTHLLQSADAWITKSGKVLRKFSLDELPQLWSILALKMSIVGPRPALWNQDDLIAERDKYGANDVRPGLTGWAQINGRDELPIDVKAKLDGEGCQRMGLFFDTRCVLATAFKVLKHDGVVEGGTGANEKEGVAK